MSIEKYDGLFILVCDNCENADGEGFFEFFEAVKSKKELGWKSKRVNGEWKDFCPECSEEGQR